MTQTVKFAITHNISSSKGWGRYRAIAADKPLVQSSTGNEWVSAPHAGAAEEGTEITVTLQTMQRVGRYKRESINTTDYKLIASPEATATLGYWNGLEVAVSGARIAEATHAHRPIEGSERGYGGGYAAPACRPVGNCETTGAHITYRCKCGAVGVSCPQRRGIYWTPQQGR